MTVIDRMNAAAHTAVQAVTDKETVNYIEAGALYGIILQGRHNVSTLSVLFNQTQDPELKKLIKKAIDDLTEKTIKKCEDSLSAGGGQVPTTNYDSHPLEGHIEIPVSVRFTDEEIAMMLANMAKTSQFGLFTALQNCYQPEIAAALYTLLDEGLDWSYQLTQLMLKRGWLPQIAKVKH
ncbi:MAG TPA: DUF3231 family protein [Selenomonadales bacterium]|nr:DUF3231 family protein [Selenomonadales bacterium]